MVAGRTVLPRLAAAFLLCVPPVLPAAASPPDAPAAVSALGSLCGPAIVSAERRYGLPSGLLAAIAVVESGRPGPMGVQPWPWTINVNGQGRFFTDQAEAVAETRRLQQAGQVSIDVGCLQVNLRHHPMAFATLQDAFDPAINADYAARYLVLLHSSDPAGDWLGAAGSYHSMTAERAQPYRQRVQAILPQVGSAAILSILAASLLRNQARTAAPDAPARRAPAGTAPEDWLVIAATDRRGRAPRLPDPLSPARALTLADTLDSMARGKGLRGRDAVR